MWSMADPVEWALSASADLAAFRCLGSADATLWVAFSGGVDSTVLLHALRTVPRTVAIHIDHGLDPASSDWAARCASVARGFGVDFEARTVRVDPGANREQAARSARYGIWKQLLASGDLLALGHHGDDQAETRLWQLMTGRDPGGMPSARALGKGRLVRPLLAVRRRDVLDYAKRHDLRWIEDPSNADLDIDRNLIRHRLVPRLEARYPGAMTRLAAPRPGPVGNLRPLTVRESSERGVQAWLLAAGLATPAKAIAEIARQSVAARDRNPCVRVVPGIRARRYHDAWHLVRDNDASATRLATPVVGCDLEIPAGTLSWRRAESGLPDRLHLSVRRRRGGERIRPVGRNRTKTLKALFQEARIPPWQRGDWPLLYRDGRLVAVPGLAVDAEEATRGGWEPLWSPRRDRPAHSPA